MNRAESSSDKPIPFFDFLPTELKLKVLSFLFILDLLKVREVNKEFSVISLDNYLWQPIFSGSFPEIHKIATALLNVGSESQIEEQKKAWNWHSIYRFHYQIHHNFVGACFSPFTVSFEDKERFWSGIGCLEIADGRIIYLNFCGFFRILDLKNGQLLKRIENNCPVWSVKPYQGKLIVAFENGSIKIIDLVGEDQPLVLKDDNEIVLFLNVFDDKIIAVSQNRMIRIWDFKTGALVDKQDMSPFVESEEKETSVEDAEDQSEGSDSEENSYKMNSVEQATFFDDKVLIRFESDQMLIWDLKNKKTVSLENPMKSHLKDLLVIDEKIIGIPWEGSIKIWDCQTGKLLHKLKVKGIIKSFKAAQGKIYLGLHDGHLEIWDYHKGSQVHRWLAHPLEVTHVDIWHDRKMITACKNMIKMWNAETGYFLFETVLNHNLERLTFDSLSGKAILALDNDSVEIWDFTSKN